MANITETVVAEVSQLKARHDLAPAQCAEMLMHSESDRDKMSLIRRLVGTLGHVHFCTDVLEDFAEGDTRAKARYETALDQCKTLAIEGIASTVAGKLNVALPGYEKRDPKRKRKRVGDKSDSSD